MLILDHIETLGVCGDQPQAAHSRTSKGSAKVVVSGEVVVSFLERSWSRVPLMLVSTQEWNARGLAEMPAVAPKMMDAVNGGESPGCEALAAKRQAAKEIVAAMGNGWKGGGSFLLQLYPGGGELIAQTDGALASATPATDHPPTMPHPPRASAATGCDHVLFRKASARFKHCTAIGDDQVVVMKIRGTAVLAGFAGEMYDPENDGATNAHTLGVWLDTGTAITNLEMVLDGRAHHHHKFLAPYLPYKKMLQEQEGKAEKAKGTQNLASAVGLQGNLGKKGGGLVVAKTKLQDATDRTKDVAKARQVHAEKVANARLAQRQKAGMAAPRMNRAQLSAFNGRGLEARLHALDASRAITSLAHTGPKDASHDYEWWIMLKATLSGPKIMFDQYGLGVWHRLNSGKDHVPYRQVGYGGKCFQLYPFVELFCGAQVLETQFLKKSQFEMRQMQGRQEHARRLDVADDISNPYTAEGKGGTNPDSQRPYSW